MKIFLALSAIVVVVSSQGLFGGFGGFVPNPSSVLNNFPTLPLLNEVQSYGEFVAKTGKKYATQAEQTLRAGIFEAKKSAVDANNAAFKSGSSTFEMGINAFADLTKAEFLKKLTGNKKSSKGEEKAKLHRNKSVPKLPKQPIPDAFDWREKGGVTPIKFQGLECGACWSFAVTGAIEGHHFKKTGNLVSLSEQHLVDCGAAFGNTGCDGGFQEYGFEYIIENKGIAQGPKYPYVEKTSDCQYRPNIKGAEITSFATIPPGDEQKMKEVIATLGPLACSVNAGPDSFQLYKSGVYSDEECNKEDVNHSILVVGYGSENGKDYWIIKNSWTDKWGEKGFMKLPRNSKSFCGIASECSYPIV